MRRVHSVNARAWRLVSSIDVFDRGLSCRTRSVSAVRWACGRILNMLTYFVPSLQRNRSPNHRLIILLVRSVPAFSLPRRLTRFGCGIMPGLLAPGSCGVHGPATHASEPRIKCAHTDTPNGSKVQRNDYDLGSAHTSGAPARWRERVARSRGS